MGYFAYNFVFLKFLSKFLVLILQIEGVKSSIFVV